MVSDECKWCDKDTNAIEYVSLLLSIFNVFPTTTTATSTRHVQPNRHIIFHAILFDYCGLCIIHTILSTGSNEMNTAGWKEEAAAFSLLLVSCSVGLGRCYIRGNTEWVSHSILCVLGIHATLDTKNVDTGSLILLSILLLLSLRNSHVLLEIW